MYKLTKKDLKEHLSSQIRFLVNSSKAYDEGFEDEAQRLSATLRILFHDTKYSTSLLKHLGIKKDIFLISSTSNYIPTNMVSYLGFITLQTTVGVGGEYIPNCKINDDMPNKWYKFENWWNEIIIDDKNNIFTRKDIVLNIADKDGGSHVDELLNEDYANLTKNNSIGWIYIQDNIEKPFENNLAYASVRQIVEEVLLSLNWLLSIQSYTRKKVDRKFEFACIEEKRYLCEIKDIPELNVLYKDKRVNCRIPLTCYVDDVKMTNGERLQRVVFL